MVDHSVYEQAVEAVRRTLTNTPGCRGVHDVRTLKMSDTIVVDARLEVDESISVKQGHNIAMQARQRVMQRN